MKKNKRLFLRKTVDKQVKSAYNTESHPLCAVQRRKGSKKIPKKVLDKVERMGYNIKAVRGSG